MKKLIFKFFLISLFTCLSFFSIDNVYAYDNNTLNVNGFVDSYKFFINDVEHGYSSFVSFPVASDLRVSIEASFKSNAFTDGGYLPNNFYQRVTMCIDTDVTGGWANNNISDVYVQRTNIPCHYYGSSYEGGRVTFATGLVSSTTLDVNKLRLHNSFGFHAYNGLSLGLLAVEFSTSPFPVYSSEETLIKQNDTIINKLDELKGSNGQLVYQQQQTNSKLDENNKLAKEKLEQDKKQHEEIMDDDTSGANSEAESFFSGFSTDTHGLTSIITAPLTLIGNITSSTCSPLALEVPFVEGKTLNLPCMSSIYKKHFGSLLNVYQIATFGLVAYWVCVRIFALVKDFKNPDHDEVEVMDL